MTPPGDARKSDSVVAAGLGRPGWKSSCCTELPGRLQFDRDPDKGGRKMIRAFIAAAAFVLAAQPTTAWAGRDKARTDRG